MAKVRDWTTAAEQLRHHVSDNDEVLAAWQTLLNDFNQHLPVLMKLSHSALTVLLYIHPLYCSYYMWHGGVMVRVLDLR